MGELKTNGEILNLIISENYISPVLLSDIIEKLDFTGYYSFEMTETFCVKELDFGFNEIISNNVPMNLNTNGTNAFWISDSTYIFSGRNNFYGSDNFDLSLVICDTLHNPIYSFIDEHAEYDFLAFWDNLSFTENTNIYLAGTNNMSYNPFETYYNHIIVNNLNDTLGLKWQKLIGGDAYYNTTNVLATEDGGCFIAATRSVNTTDYDMYFIKLDSEGNYVGINKDNQPLKISELILYPNPATDLINIRLGAHLKNVTIEIYDISGKNVLTQKLENIETQINITELVSGNYIYKCFDKERVIETGKFVKE